jgi:hypothetical protein
MADTRDPLMCEAGMAVREREREGQRLMCRPDGREGTDKWAQLEFKI